MKKKKKPRKISNILSLYGLRISFWTQLSLFIFLYNTKDEGDPLKKSAVYELTCTNCSVLYLGKTSRSFDVRFNEHFCSYRNEINRFDFSNHCLEANHKFPNKGNTTVLHFQLDLLESEEIRSV